MNDSLQHHGVLGMKWGVRRDPERTPRQTRKEVKSARIQTALNRVNKDPDEVIRVFNILAVKGERYANKILNDMGKDSVRTVSQSVDRQNRKDIIGTLAVLGAAPIAGWALSQIQ